MSLLLMMQITLIRKWKVHHWRVDQHTQTLKNTLFNCTAVIGLVMKIQPFKSNEHWRSLYWTKYNFLHFCMLKCIIVYKIQNRNTSNKGEYLIFGVNFSASFCISTYELGKKLMNLFILPWFDFHFSHKKILSEIGPIYGVMSRHHHYYSSSLLWRVVALSNC